MATETGIDQKLDRLLGNARRTLLAWRTDAGHWTGELSSSALATATAVGALAKTDPQAHQPLISAGLRWLSQNQNADGGWGDTVLSRSNISTTLLAWSAFALGDPERRHREAATRAEERLCRETGDLNPESLAAVLTARYGGDRTFSAPILSMCALSGRLGPEPQAWRLVFPLPFEVAALPHRILKWLRLPVVSYALPALIAIGQLRFRRLPPRNPLLRGLRRAALRPTLRRLGRIQPEGGGYLEAVPLTAFVTMSLAHCGLRDDPVVRSGLDFLRRTARADGSWPIDTNLATWCSTLAVNALLGGRSEPAPELPGQERLQAWLLGQQYRKVHPYTQAPPGGWAWTDLPGGVPDADDTSGALLALKKLGGDRQAAARQAAEGAGWLLGLQNRDGGIPTFCRGWGALPFDRSCPDLTAHALRAWNAWAGELPGGLQSRIAGARGRAVRYLLRSQRPEGAWEPLWFGNESAPGEANLLYGTSRVLLALQEMADFPAAAPALEKGMGWLLESQNADGGWGGAPGVASSIEETALALEALAGLRPLPQDRVGRALDWIDARTRSGTEFPPTPIGLYFARLWYYERLYPLIFTVAALQKTAAEICR